MIDMGPTYEGPGESLGGGEAEPVEPDHVDQLSDALRALGPGCKGFFGGADTIEKLAANMKSAGLKVVAVGGKGYDDIIQNGSETYRAFWERDPIGIATAVGYGSEDKRPGRYLSIILSPKFFSRDPAVNKWFDPRAIGGYAATDAGFAAFQRDALVHEYMHIYTNLSDPKLTDYWRLGAKGYDVNNPSLAIAQFIKNDCQSAP